MAMCERYVEIALSLADFSDVTALAIDGTLRARGHDYLTLAANAVKRRAHRRVRCQDDQRAGCPPR